MSLSKIGKVSNAVKLLNTAATSGDIATGISSLSNSLRAAGNMSAGVNWISKYGKVLDSGIAYQALKQAFPEESLTEDMLAKIGYTANGAGKVGNASKFSSVGSTFAGLGTFLKSIWPVLAVVGGIAAGTAAWKWADDKFTITKATAKKHSDESAQAYQNAKTELSTKQSQYDTNQDRIHELRATQNRTSDENAELSQLTKESSAAALTSNAGSSTQPVYFSGGKPVACSYTLGKSVPADALFTDHTYGNMKGATSSSAGSAGLVPAPNIGEQLKFLRADGTWVIPTNTTYSVGTTSYSGTTKLYTSTGSATDGTMTQNAITTALNGKSATGHTHNYAGSSSVGGNANAAVKLATARKIGSASFDGTTDITLSQMGVINPIELTRAEYEDLIINNRIDDNQYYNVIDDYDSDILINDSSVSKKYVYSSDKTEKTYSKKSTTSTVTLSASAWSGSSTPYSCVLSVEGVTATNIIEINYASSASDAAIKAYQGAGLKDGGQSAGRITLLATEKPTVNIPITIIVRNDL